MENRSAVVIGAVVSHADDFGERASALRLLGYLAGSSRQDAQRRQGRPSQNCPIWKWKIPA